jgi:acyl carrier protein
MGYDIKRSSDPQLAILSIVSRRSGIPAAKLSLEQRLLQDLGIDGDDASELLLDLSGQFGVDLTALNFEKHFRPEPNLFSVLRSPLVKQKERADKIPVTIRDLIVAANTGKWPL